MHYSSCLYAATKLEFPRCFDYDVPPLHLLVLMLPPFAESSLSVILFLFSPYPSELRTCTSVNSIVLIRTARCCACRLRSRAAVRWRSSLPLLPQPPLVHSVAIPNSLILTSFSFHRNWPFSSFLLDFIAVAKYIVAR